MSSIDAVTGAVNWSGKILHAATLSGMTYYHGALYFGTDDYEFQSLDARTGAERWKVFLGAIPDSAVASGGLVYTSTNSGGVYALDAATGTQVWVSESFGGYYATPALSAGVIYVGGNDQSLHALDAATGLQIWSYPTGNHILYSSPTVAGGVVFVASDDMYLYAVNAATGALVWKRQMDVPGYPTTSPAVANGVVYATANGTVRAFRASDGKPLWQTHVSESAGSPIVANGVVYVTGGLDGTFHALDAATGAPLWSFTAGGAFADPIVANGIVYAGSLDRNLYAFDLPA